MPEKSTSNAKIVANKSEGYNYKYSNLADLARDGVNIPKMRVKPTEHGEYIEWYDEKLGEWQLGARVVMFESKGMNAAQTYGAALTYARRYTVQLAESVACDDDNAVEKAKPINGRRPVIQKATPPSDKQINFLKMLLKNGGKNDAEIEKTIEQAKKATSTQVSAWIEAARKLPGNEGGNNGQA